MNNTLLNQLSAVNFALWDMHLYLDTHPDDSQIFNLWQQYAQKSQAIRNEYEKSVGALTVNNATGTCWTREPWPWQKDCR